MKQETGEEGNREFGQASFTLSTTVTNSDFLVWDSKNSPSNTLDTILHGVKRTTSVDTTE